MKIEKFVMSLRTQQLIVYHLTTAFFGHYRVEEAQGTLESTEYIIICK